MLARYPKVEPVPPNLSCNHHLPRLCLRQELESDQSATTTDRKSGTENDGCAARRGCDSAPVLYDRSSTSFRFVFEGRDPRYPKQVRVDPNPHVRWFSSASGGSTVIHEVDDGQMTTNDNSCEEDIVKISRCLQLLHCSGYYYEGLSWQQASVKLRKCRVGTFLVRESENANFLFTLSVQTKMGPTSIRIAYKGGLFRLDAEEELVRQMPVFPSVTDLVEYYVRVSKQLPVKSDPTCCWLDLAGECTAPVELYQPLYKRVQSLKHLCRLTVVKEVLKNGPPRPDSWTSLGLPVALQDYLVDYLHSQ